MKTWGYLVDGRFIVRDKDIETVYHLCEKWIQRKWWSIEEKTPPTYIRTGNSFLARLFLDTCKIINLKQRESDVILDVVIDASFNILTTGKEDAYRYMWANRVLDLLDYIGADIDDNVYYNLFSDIKEYVERISNILPLFVFFQLTIFSIGSYSMLKDSLYLVFSFWILVAAYQGRIVKKMWSRNKIILKTA